MLQLLCDMAGCLCPHECCLPSHLHCEGYTRASAIPPQERLFEQLLQLISATMHAGSDARARRSLLRQLGCKAQEVTTTLLKHLAKEEEQLFPLLLQHFSYAEQACHLHLLQS